MEATPGAAAGDRWQGDRPPDRRGAPRLTRVFFDSSAFAKRYIDESGTEQVLGWCERADELVLSVIALPEMISAFCRLQREGRLTPAAYRRIKRDLMADLGDALLCDTTPQLLQRVVRALESSTLRGMDAIHIGAAQEAEAEVFVSADARQCIAARAAGPSGGGAVK